MPLGNVVRWIKRNRPMEIHSYRGFGNARMFYFKGRVLKHKGITALGDTDRIWHNIRKTYRRFESDEIPGAKVRARFKDIQQEATANDEGYFEITLKQIGELPADFQWHPVQISLLHPPAKKEPVEVTGHVLVPPPHARYGIISDLDDTVLRSDATSWWRMARKVIFGNARTRLPFPGVAAFYHALQQGSRDAGATNPLFYVSSGPWNLYDLLMEFFELRGIPVGPLFLRDWGLRETVPTRHRNHKLAIARLILDSYPSLPFILIGDSGQKDPEIYEEIVRLYPNRILAIYIRNVTENAGRKEAIGDLAGKVLEAGSSLILADDTAIAARHAIDNGWIDASFYEHIIADKKTDSD